MKIEEDINEKGKQYDELNQKIPDAEKKAEEIDGQMGNLTDPEILSMVKSFHNEFIAFSKSVLNSGDMTQLSLKIRTINTDQIQTLNLLTEKANDNCSQCKSGKRKEVIDGGMTQTVHWDGDYVVREEIDYEKNLNH